MTGPSSCAAWPTPRWSEVMCRQRRPTHKSCARASSSLTLPRPGAWLSGKTCPRTRLKVPLVAARLLRSARKAPPPVSRRNPRCLLRPASTGQGESRRPTASKCRARGGVSVRQVLLQDDHQDKLAPQLRKPPTGHAGVRRLRNDQHGHRLRLFPHLRRLPRGQNGRTPGER